MGGTITAVGSALPPTTPASGSSTATPSSAAPPSLSDALANLQKAVSGLQAAVDAMVGARQISGGGGGSGCGCGGGGGTLPIPVQESISFGAPTAASKKDAAEKGNGPGDSKPSAGGVRDKIVDLARKELAKGVREDAGSDKDKGGNIRRYRTAVTGPGENPDAAEAWCADFASYIWKQAGVPFGKNGQGEDYTVAMIDWAKKNGRWNPRSEATPKPGDLVLIDWKPGSGVDHVAIVEKVENGKVYTIGGNESDSIKNQSYSVGDKRLMGYIPPAGG